MMDCERIAELLPWYLNGTLETDEQRQVREHLAECETCRQELDDTLLGGAIYQQHVPRAALVNYAFERPLGEVQREALEQHLETCPTCSEELAWVQESRRREAAEGPGAALEVMEPVPWWRVWSRPSAALTAGLVGLLLAAGGGLFWSRQQIRALRAQLAAQQRVAQERAASQQAATQQWREAAAQLQAQQEQARRETAQLSQRIQSLESPQLNIPILDVYPGPWARGSARPLVNELRIPRGVPALTLILNAQNPARYREYSLELVDAQGRVVWRAAGLVRQSGGGYTIHLPREFVSPGRYTLHLYGQAPGPRRRVESYPLRIVTGS